MKKILIAILFVVLISCETEKEESITTEEITKEYAISLAHKMLIVDAHIDLPYRLLDDFEDISQRTRRGDVDYPRMVKGGLNAPFMSIFVPASHYQKGTGKEFADDVIDLVYGFEEKWPDKFRIATSVEDIKQNFKENIISLPMGIENGTAIENDLANLKHFYERGVRYICLTHSENNAIGASSYDMDRTWDGLTDFGKNVVREMNRLGIMVDVSHVSDSTFWDVLEITETPPIVSHSSCRYYTPGMERNMSDEMIKALAEKGGVIMINFGTYFINAEYQEKMRVAWDSLGVLKLKGEQRETFLRNFKINNNVPQSHVIEVVAHIDHVVQLVGIDHVGFGSDFDGVGDLPFGLEDVSKYPNIIYELLKQNYSIEDIEKICSGNIFRVWKEVEEFAENN